MKAKITHYKHGQSTKVEVCSTLAEARGRLGMIAQWDAEYGGYAVLNIRTRARLRWEIRQARKAADEDKDGPWAERLIYLLSIRKGFKPGLYNLDLKEPHYIYGSDYYTEGVNSYEITKY